MAATSVVMATAITAVVFGSGVWAQSTPAAADTASVQFGAIAASLEQAAANHPSVQSARQGRIGSEAGYDAARWQYYPSASIATERGSNETQRSLGATTSTTLRLQQNLWAGGRIDASVSAAQRRVQVAQLSVLEAQHTVASRTLDAWLALLTAFGRQQTTQLGLSRLQRLAEMMGRRVDRDISPGVDAMLMRSRVTQAKSDLLAQVAAQDNANERLAQWVGQPSHLHNLDSATLTQTLQDAVVRLPASTLTDILDALDTQPALRRNAAEVALAQDEVEQKKAEAWPVVYARAERQFIDPGAGSFGVKTAQNKLYLGLQYAPGAGLAVVANIQVAASRVAALTQDRQSIRRELQDRVQTDWRDHVTTAVRLSSARDAVNSASEVLESYTRLFVVGRRGWLDVLNAARELNQAELALTDLQAQQVTSLHRLRIYRGLFAWQRGG